MYAQIVKQIEILLYISDLKIILVTDSLYKISVHNHAKTRRFVYQHLNLVCAQLCHILCT